MRGWNETRIGAVETLGRLLWSPNGGLWLGSYMRIQGRSSWAATSLLAGAMWLLTGCAATGSNAVTGGTTTTGGTPSVSTTAPATVSATMGAPTPAPETRGTPMTDYPAVVERAAAALSAELGTDRRNVTVRRAERTEWSDSSLGCPEPGKAYLQVITPGYRVTLEANGRSYEYHTDLRDLAVRCPK